jgi:hypothetical protein
MQWSNGLLSPAGAAVRYEEAVSVVSVAEMYRGYAKDCIRWAWSARTDQERDAFLEMARAWTEIAAREDDGGFVTADRKPDLAKH